MGPLDLLWMRRLRAAFEVELVCCGGEPLLEDARTEASWYADLHHPWDRTGSEPAARVNAWMSILAVRARIARRDRKPLDGCRPRD
ncbi:hypothetical protein [Pseudonocardia endophytica]|uniref:Uncharacterized protein n=1 Tax=Pseudonocardia endophytica TaxID=401976 RepID=A0A4R1HQ12_PSEEN|nr:hypothetical protein [Pseudonocardia endophytica]TCK24667.1 hypothetical protein EV378_0453 [Pseudonocardia endophytica]